MGADLLIWAYPALLLWAMVSDAARYTIPNRISVLLVAAFVLAAALTGLPLVALAWQLLYGLIALAICFVLFSLRLFGGGDAKLIAATVPWINVNYLPTFVLYISILGGGIVLLLLAFRRLPLPARLARIGWLAALHEPERGVPYALAIGGAGLLVFPGLSLPPS